MASLPIGEFSWEPMTVKTLPNGLTIVVKEDHTAPLAVTDVWFGVGSRLETDAVSGIAHFLEHTLFKGTPKRGPGQIAAEIEGFGGRTNAGTSIDYTHYYISCESRHIFKALDIHADVFRNSTLKKEAIDSERSVILEEIKRSKDTPNRVLWDIVCKTMFTVHPYGRPTLGSVEAVRAGISPEAMMAFFSSWYVPKNMAILVVGDVDSKAIVKKLEELYGDIPPKELPASLLRAEPPTTEPKIIRKEMEVDRGYLQMAFRTVSHARAVETRGLVLLEVILGMGRSSRLSIALKERSSLVTSISACQISLVDDGMFIIRAEYDPSDESKVLSGIREEIKRLIDEPVPQSELQKAKDYLESLYIRSAETAEGKAEILGEAIVQKALDEEKRYLETMRGVTSGQLQTLANTFFAKEGFVLVLLGPKPDAVEIQAEPGKAVPPDTRKFLLGNGMRLIHRRIRGTGLIGACLAIDAGARRDNPGKTGVSNLTSEMLFKGTTHREGMRTLWDIEAIGAELSPSSEPDFLRISLSVPAKRAAEAIAILADLTRNPTFPSDAFKVEKSKVLARLKSVPDNMFENTWRLFHSNLYKGHPYANYVLGTQEDVASITTQDLRDFHTHWFTPGRMVLSVVGDLDADEAVKLASIHFGFPGTGAEEMAMAEAEGEARATTMTEVEAEAEAEAEAIAVTRAAIQPVSSFVRVQDKRKKKQAMVCLGWLGPGIGHSDYAAMKVLNALFGGGMSARLFRKIRNQASLAYATQGVFPSRVDGGAFCAIIGTDPGAVDKVTEMVLAEIRDISENGVDRPELDRAVAYVSGQFALEHAESARIAHYLAWFESIGAGFAYNSGYLDELKAVTVEDMKRVARTYLSPDKAVLAITGPAAVSR